MAIYDKPVRLLMRGFVADCNVSKGQVISRDQVTSWFKSKYPKIKPATVTAHLAKMSVNAPSRVHYNANTNGDDDLFYQIDGGHFRLYDAATDPSPIYEKNQSLDLENYEKDKTEDEPPKSSEFAYESDLRDFLSRNLTIIEQGLKLYEEEGIIGVEFPVGGRFIDILAVDRGNHFIVIELKVSRGYDRVIGQLLRYMTWIETNLAEPNQMVRGIIIAKEISNDLRLAALRVPDVQLFEYELSISLKEVRAQGPRRV